MSPIWTQVMFANLVICFLLHKYLVYIWLILGSIDYSGKRKFLKIVDTLYYPVLYSFGHILNGWLNQWLQTLSSKWLPSLVNNSNCTSVYFQWKSKVMWIKAIQIIVKCNCAVGKGLSHTRFYFWLAKTPG